MTSPDNTPAGKEAIDRAVEKFIDSSPGNPAVKAAIERALGNFQVVGDPTPEEEQKHSRVETLERMEKAGYPLRARLNLPKMYGPGLEKAKELLPLVLNDCMLLLVGERGPGKTQIATWLAYQRRMRHGKSVGIYIHAMDLFDAIKETWQTQESEDSVLRRYRRAKFLVIDEIHERGESPWEDRRLVSLLVHRYNDLSVTILVGNIAEDQVSKRISPSILSRIKETGGLINCDWKSYR